MVVVGGGGGEILGGGGGGVEEEDGGVGGRIRSEVSVLYVCKYGTYCKLREN